MAAVNRLNVSAGEYLKQGVEAQAAGRIHEAIELHMRALEKDPEMLQAHINLIVLYANAGDTQLAEQHYRKGVEINPDNAELHYNFGVLTFGAERYVEAKQAFARSLQVNPDYAMANNNMGQMVEQEGNLAEAMRYYRKAIASEPNYALAHYHLGRMLMAQGRASDAVAEFRKAVEEEGPQTAGYLMGLASAYAATEQWDAAIQAAQGARERASDLGQSEFAAQIDARIEQYRSQRR